MTATIVLILTSLIFLLLLAVVARAIASKQQLIGRPPVNAVFFVLAKLLVVVNLAFLVMKGLNIGVHGIFDPPGFVEIIALASLLIGVVVLYLSTFALKKDLIFGLSSSGDHKLQTRGIYSISRHPFYLGFIFILFSSCLFTPHVLNIAAFLGAWVIHHRIMIKEEQFLSQQYGDEYRQYAENVKRYITIKF